MGINTNLLNALSTFLSSSFDVGSDLINSLDFMGYNASETISDTVYGTPKALTGNNVSTFLQIRNGTNSSNISEGMARNTIISISQFLRF